MQKNDKLIGSQLSLSYAQHQDS